MAPHTQRGLHHGDEGGEGPHVAQQQRTAFLWKNTKQTIRKREILVTSILILVFWPHCCVSTHLNKFKSGEQEKICT